METRTKSLDFCLLVIGIARKAVSESSLLIPLHDGLRAGRCPFPFPLPLYLNLSIMHNIR